VAFLTRRSRPVPGGLAGGGEPRPGMPSSLRAAARASRGFLAEDEGLRLYALAAEVSEVGPCLEVGGYCGKSALYLGGGCRAAGRHPLVSVDHHRGSEEQQPGGEYFDADLWHPELQRVDSLPEFLRTVERAGLAEWVVPVVASSVTAARCWPERALALVFLDGGHGEEDAFRDYHCWAPKLRRGGYLCVHDLHPDPANGGQAPYRMFEYALSTRAWDEVAGVGTLGILRRR